MPNTTAKKMPNRGGPPYLAFGATLLMGAALVVGAGYCGGSEPRATVTTPLPRGSGFSANACVNYRYVSCRRLRPSPKEFLSYWLSLSRECCAARHGAGSFSPSRPQTFYREKDSSPEPAISGSQEASETSLADIEANIAQRGGARGFLRQLKQTVPAS